MSGPANIDNPLNAGEGCGPSPEDEVALETLTTASVTEFRQKYRSALESSQPRARWGIILGIRLPEGVSQHPRLADRVEQQLGRICAIDLREPTDVRVSFGAESGNAAEAEDEARSVAGSLLQFMGLEESALVEVSLRARPTPS